MAGTRAGGLKAREKNLASNPNFYRDLGRLGGSAPTTAPKGFAAMSREDHVAASKKGGRTSKRTKGETWHDASKANSTSSASTSRTSTTDQSAKSSSTSNGGDLDRKTSNFLDKFRRNSV